MRDIIKADWDKHLAAVRPVFELASMLLTTAAWTSVSATCAFLAVRGYHMRSPALSALGWMSDVMYFAVIGPFVLVALVTSILLLLAVWSMLVKAHFYMALVGGWQGNMALLLKGPYYFAAAVFLFMIVVIPTVQILDALGYTPNQIAELRSSR